MEIILTPSAGFCHGVKRAIRQTEALIEQGDHRRVVTLGPLIHNSQELRRLADLGVVVVSETDITPGDIVVTRSHGLPVQQLERLRNGAKVENATCPHVRACQQQAARMAAQGYAVIIVADCGHPETESIVSYAEQGASAATSPPPVMVVDSVSALVPLKTRKVAVLAQTTMSMAVFQQVVAACCERYKEVRALNTICQATGTRQQEAVELARRVELMLIVGGRQSANTTRLATLCRELQPKTYHIENKDEIDDGWFSGVGRVGVTAGASTPSWVIQDVITRLERIG